LIVHNGAPVHGRVREIVLKKARRFSVEKRTLNVLSLNRVKITMNVVKSQNFYNILASQDYSSVSLQKMCKKNFVVDVSKANII
jgi:hypothetical protein